MVPTRGRKMMPVVVATGKTIVHLLMPRHQNRFLKTKTIGLTRSREPVVAAETKIATTRLKTAQRITIVTSQRTRSAEVTQVVGKAIREAAKDSETHHEALLKRAAVLVLSPLLYPATTAPPTTDAAVQQTIKRRNNLMATILGTTTISRRPSSRQARYRSRRRPNSRILHVKATMAVAIIEMTTTPINQVSTRSQEPLSD